MIQRFEDEFPDMRAERSEAVNHSTSAAITITSPSNDTLSPHNTYASYAAVLPDEEDSDPYALRLSRRSSNTSLHSRALTSEEGRVHRVSQQARRDILESGIGDDDRRHRDRDSAVVCDAHGLTESPDVDQMHALREKIRRLTRSASRSPARSTRRSSGERRGEQTEVSVLDELDSGHVDPETEKKFEELGYSLSELIGLHDRDPEAFERFKQSQMAAQINASVGKRLR